MCRQYVAFLSDAKLQHHTTHSECSLDTGKLPQHKTTMQAPKLNPTRFERMTLRTLFARNSWNLTRYRCAKGSCLDVSLFCHSVFVTVQYWCMNIVQGIIMDTRV